MCGIAGFFGLAIGASDAQTLVSRMCDEIRHRGPDGHGVTVHDDVALGMVRLAIVDVEHGMQPMLSDDGSVALVFNGEIYNAPALREQLEAVGVRFQTRSDTEVILRLYERNPDDVESHLRGMWAFAIHDRRRGRVVLSRDRFGIKPLYICARAGALAFGSEVRALNPLRSFDKLAAAFQIDSGAAHALLSWAYIPNEASVYSGVEKIAPATRVEFDLTSGHRKSRRHYVVQPFDDATRVRTLGEACELVEPAIKAAIREHLESDVPIAAFLSGGIDSSLVLAYAIEQSSKPISAFTIGFREPRFDESTFARRVANALGIQLHVEILDEATALASLDEAMGAFDEPFGDSSSLATHLLSKVVSRTHKVALGGDGGDEIFAGYKRYRIIDFRDRLGRIPALRRACSAALSALPARTDRTTATFDALRTARRVARGLAGSDAQAYLALTQVAALSKTRPLVMQPAEVARFEQPILDTFNAAPGSQLRKTLSSDFTNPLPNDMLVKVDRASMACGLEVRVPLLDHRLVEIGLSLPREFTLKGGGKRVLKELYARRFGTELAQRKKTGFGVPVEEWLRGPLASTCDSTFDGPIDQCNLSSRALANGAWRRWANTDAQLLWHAFALARWSS